MFKVYNTKQEVVCQHSINLNQWYRYLLSSKPTTAGEYYRSVVTLHSISILLYLLTIMMHINSIEVHQYVYVIYIISIEVNLPSIPLSSNITSILYSV